MKTYYIVMKVNNLVGQSLTQSYVIQARWETEAKAAAENAVRKLQFFEFKGIKSCEEITTPVFKIP